jgi:hypothetical protein
MARKTGHRAAQPTSPEPEQSTITAGDIVQKLMRITRRGNTGTLMERVRGWTKEKFRGLAEHVCRTRPPNIAATKAL